MDRQAEGAGVNAPAGDPPAPGNRIGEASPEIGGLAKTLIPDGAEMLVDAEHDQDEFSDDAREHDADDDAGDGVEQHQESGERVERHRGQPRENPGQAEQTDQCDDQPVERLDNRWRDKTVPLE